MSKPILCLDFDGVLHSYTSGWQGAKIISDGPVIGTVEFLAVASEHFTINIFSLRSHQEGGIEAMKTWLSFVIYEQLGEMPDWFSSIEFPTAKPPAMLTIDDRAITFTGVWPDPIELLNFKPWNKK